jgi:hypothetical protein
MENTEEMISAYRHLDMLLFNIDANPSLEMEEAVLEGLMEMNPSKEYLLNKMLIFSSFDHEVKNNYIEMFKNVIAQVSNSSMKDEEIDRQIRTSNLE